MPKVRLQRARLCIAYECCELRKEEELRAAPLTYVKREQNTSHTGLPAR